MCGRFSAQMSWQQILDLYDLFPTRQTPPFAPRYNIAPTQPILMVANDDAGERHYGFVRWGFLPQWVKDPADFTLIINARSETAATKPSFRNAMRHRRALIPASGFCEWKRFGKGKRSQAYWVRPRDGSIVSFGALMETWSDPDGSQIDTGCILTTAANEGFADIHHRLPLVIMPEDFERWLDCKTQEPRDVFDLMRPVADDYFEAIPVGDAVNKVANSSPDVQKRAEPIAEETSDTASDDSQMSLF
ncbi:MAG: SOS response-associated peptidase [Ahrensia sp.]|nr:SOS response-associated peptidase [Ahrensia sp.]